MKPPVGSLCATQPFYKSSYNILFRTYDDALHDFRILARPDPGEPCVILEHAPLGFSRILHPHYGPVWIHTEEVSEGDVR